MQNKALQAPGRGRFLVAVLVAGLALLGGWIQSQVHVNHDVGWVVHSAGWMLDGARLGSDILAANPPLIWWLSLPAAWFARVSGLPQADAIRLFAWLVCLTSILAVHRALVPWRREDGATGSNALLLAIASVLLVLPGDSFAQREHFSLALVVPYAAWLFAWVQTGIRPSRRAAILAGAAAGIGLALKPHFLLVAFALEATVLHQQRRTYRAWRPETVTLGTVIGGYVVLVLLFAPDYLTQAVPLFKQVYWGFENVSLSQLLQRLWPGAMALLAAVIIAWTTRSLTVTHAGLAAVALAYAGAYLIQFKGYAYHRYPFTALSLVLLALAIALGLRRLLQRPQSARRPAGLLGAAAILASGVLLGAQQGLELGDWLGKANRWHGATGQRISQLVRTVDALVEGPDDTVYAFSTHPYPGFPIMNEVRARWGARANAQFMIPAIFKLSGAASGADAERLAGLEALARRLVREDFDRRLPRVLLVDRGRQLHAIGYQRFDFIGFYSRDPVLANRLARFEYITQIGRIAVYRRLADPAAARAGDGDPDQLGSPP